MGETTMDFHGYVSLLDDQRFNFSQRRTIFGPRDEPLNGDSTVTVGKFQRW